MKFVICAGLILLSGSRLSNYAHTISKKGVFSAGLMGILFLSAITSCPELFTSLGSISIVSAPDLASGDLIGAVIINILAIGLLGFFYKKKSILKGQNNSNILSAALTIVMLGIVIASLSSNTSFFTSISIFNVGLGSIVIGLTYIIAMHIIYKKESHSMKNKPKGKVAPSLWAKFVFASIVIIFSGFWLAKIGDQISTTYGWSQMWVGLVFMAIATTLPEFIVSLTALKLNSAHMAVGNFLGSNFFNIFIIFILDIFFRRGQFLSYVSHSNIYPAFIAILLTSVILIRMLKTK